MANLSKTKALFGFTSPRTVEKIIPEIGLLIQNFGGRKWDRAIQKAYFDVLFNSGFYEGDKRPQNEELAARDRITRAPKALGFIDLKPAIRLTAAGEALLSGKRTHEVFTKQLFKFQLPSPFHKIPSRRGFNVRPYLELLRLVKVLGDVSKTEIALFFLQLTDYRLFDRLVEAIQQYRLEARAYSGNRKKFDQAIFRREIEKIYAEDIAATQLKTRESDDVSLTKFISTKRSNSLDYADAFIRYLRSTQLISFQKRTFRLMIAPSRLEEVDFLLSTVERQALIFQDEEEYEGYLFDPGVIRLLTDDRSYLEAKLNKLKRRFGSGLSIEELKDLLEITEEETISGVIETTQRELRDFAEFDDIMEVFDDLLVKKAAPDPSLYLEWNSWRAFVMLNDAREVAGNFRFDLDGQPLSTAPGNVPDIRIDYEEFQLIVEVTMSSGSRQYEMEGEPVARHFGRLQLSSSVPVYCLFIAPRINENSMAHFFNLNRIRTALYGGRTRIIPVSVDQFIALLQRARDKQFNHRDTLRQLLDTIINENLRLEDESTWMGFIEATIAAWMN
jgi:hypothetical protein